MSSIGDSEVAALIYFLDAQRLSVLAIVDGLDDSALSTALFPSGWTPLGLIEHLTDAEWVWFQKCAAGSTEEPTWVRREAASRDAPGGPRATDTMTAYQRQCRQSNEVLARLPLSALPAKLNPAVTEPVDNIRWIALHMIEETARHAGHLDTARELIDGRTGLGPR